MRRVAFFVLVLCLAAGAVFSQSVVASTSWTAAIARAAGATDVVSLAPPELTHPPEYELRPSDLLRVREADVAVYAGYEVMVERLVEAAEATNVTMVRIRTGYNRDILEQSIRAVAEVIDTQSAAEASIERLTLELSRWRRELARRGLEGARVLAHFHQQGLARELGFDVVGVFGPAPLEAAGIRDLSAQDSELIIDNGHNPVAAPLAETVEAPLVVWYNFPGFEGTESLLDVLRHNRRALAAELDSGL